LALLPVLTANARAQGAAVAGVEEEFPAIATAAALSFGTFPAYSLVRLEAFYADLALYLSEAIKRPVRFGTSSSHERFRERLARSEFDVAFVQASDYTQYAAASGYVPLLRARAAAVVFFVAPNSDVRTVADLRGHALALPPIEEDSTSVSLDHLRRSGLQPDRDVAIHYLPQNSACLHHVLSGRSEAGAVLLDALHFLGVRADVDYRIIAEGPRVAPPLFVSAGRLSQADREALKVALLAWSARGAGQGGAGGWMELLVVEDGDYVVEAGAAGEQSSKRSGGKAGAGDRKPRGGS